MASNSFALKGWAITLVCGIFALSAKEANNVYFLVTYIPLFIFWFLDSYYLQLERKYKVLYNSVIKDEPNNLSFNLTPKKSNWEEKTMYIQSFVSRTELGFYLPTAILIGLVIIIANYM